LEKEIIGGFQLNYEFYSGKDFYSDGDIEDVLLDICKNGDIEKNLQEGNSWPVLYHLSKERENLLEWYDFGENKSLLEIGSGCGALTGLFGRKLDRVVCIELSKRRSLINANKNGKTGKAEIYVGNFQEVKLDEKFDYITLIGVFEYSKLYINGEKPFHTMLEKLKGNLKEGGKVIIAIENKMGLKYFSGMAEDHTGSPFDGLNNYVRGESAVTFSKPEIEKILNECGFGDMEFYYPMPDYKLPKVVYSEDFCPRKGDLRDMGQVFSGENYKLFEEDAVFDVICEDGQFPYFANSFLIVAGLDRG